jgi:hypothetical protein
LLMTDRVIELAIEALENRKTAINQEIARLRGAGNSTQARIRTDGRRRTRRKRTAAEKKAQSDAMKAYWARRRAGASSETGAKARRRARA